MTENGEHPWSLRSLGLVAGTPERLREQTYWRKIFADDEAVKAAQTEAEFQAGLAALPPSRPTLTGLVDWDTLATIDQDADWICEPVIPTGRAVLIVAAAKAGKSELALAVAVAVALGTRIFGLTPNPQPVLYVDAEMSSYDLVERLEELAIDPASLKGRLYLYQGPQIPLDSPAAYGALLAAALACGAKLVILDTFRRLADGDENDATTVARWHAAAVAPLIHAGISVLVLHHLGKDTTRGGRGSSEFTGWPDVVWNLERVENGTKLTATHKRVSWVDTEIVLRRTEDPLRFERVGRSWADGTEALAARMTALGITAETPTKAAQQALTEAGQGARRSLVVEASKWLRSNKQTTRIPNREPEWDDTE